MQEVSAMGNSMSKQVLDGNAGYTVVQGNRTDMNEEEVKKAQVESSPFPEINYLSQDLTLEKIEDIDGVKAYKIKVSDILSVYYSIETGLKIKEVQTEETGSMFSCPRS